MTFTNYTALSVVPAILSEYKAWNCPTPQCHRMMDVVLIVDESGSVDAGNWAKEMSFASKLVDSYVISPEAANFGVVYFADIGRTVVDLTDDAALVKRMLLTTVRRGGSTCITTGLANANKVFAHPMSHRENASRVLLFIGDGQETCNYDTILQQLALLPVGTTRMVISPSNTSYNLGVLKDIAANPNNVILATFNTLTTKLDQIVQQTCTEMSEHPCGASCSGICGCDNQCLCPRCTNSSTCMVSTCDAGDASCSPLVCVNLVSTLR